MNQKEVALRNLLIASLISEGHVLVFNNQKITEFYVPYLKEKAYYLFNYLKTYDLGDFVIVEPRKKQFKILLKNGLDNLINEWYEDGNKIFNLRLGDVYLNHNLIILYINLFGSRKIEGIGIPTTIDKEYLQTLTYCIEKILKVDVVIGNNQLKIPDVPMLFINSIDHLSSIDSSEMANFITNQEKEQLMDLFNSDQKRRAFI